MSSFYILVQGSDLIQDHIDFIASLFIEDVQLEYVLKLVVSLVCKIKYFS